MINQFKFLTQFPKSPLLENEQRIGYWTGDYFNITQRVIAWYRNVHMNSWRRMTYIGTMEQFFRYRLEIPVIEQIKIPPSRLSEQTREFHEGDGPYLSLHTFGNYRIEITYYEYI